MNDDILELLTAWEEAYEGGVDCEADELTGEIRLREELRARIARRRRLYAAMGLGPGPRPLPRSTVVRPDSGTVAGVTEVLPMRIGKYEVVRRIGRGGMGDVFEAFDPALKRSVAIKTLRPDLATAEFRERFRREAVALAALNSDVIVAIHQFEFEDDVPYFVMPLLQGESLDSTIRRHDGRPMPVDVALQIARQIAGALALAHERGVLHRDLKPGNIWLEAGTSIPRVKLLDFGLTCSVNPATANDTETPTATGTLLGSPGYMAPEQAVGGEVGAASDLFGLGAVLYRMTTGRAPFPGDTLGAVLMRMAQGAPPAPRTINAHIGPALSALTMALLEHEAAKRPQSAREVVARLDAIAVSDRPATARRRRIVAAIFAALGLCAAATTVGIVARGPRGDPRDVGGRPSFAVPPATMTTFLFDDFEIDRLPGRENPQVVWDEVVRTGNVRVGGIDDVLGGSKAWRAELLTNESTAALAKWRVDGAQGMYLRWRARIAVHPATASLILLNAWGSGGSRFRLDRATDPERNEQTVLRLAWGEDWKSTPWAFSKADWHKFALYHRPPAEDGTGATFKVWVDDRQVLDVRDAKLPASDSPGEIGFWVGCYLASYDVAAGPHATIELDDVVATPDERWDVPGSDDRQKK